MVSKKFVQAKVFAAASRLSRVWRSRVLRPLRRRQLRRTALVVAPNNSGFEEG
jgi:hypothetical protein